MPAFSPASPAIPGDAQHTGGFRRPRRIRRGAPCPQGWSDASAPSAVAGEAGGGDGTPWNNHGEEREKHGRGSR